MPTAGVTPIACKHRRQLDPPGMTGRAGRGRHSVESRQDFGADAADERDIERVREPVLRVPVENHTIAEPLLQLLPEPVAQSADPLHRRQVARELAGRAEADREQRAFGAGAPPAFVARAVDQRLEPHAAAHVQRTDALGGIELVAGDRQQIDAELVDVGGDLADRLGRVGVEQDAVLAGDRARTPRSAGSCRPRCWRA